MHDTAPSWNHNNHYHDFLLAHVPENATTALDIGCGAGDFARRLAATCRTVAAIDPDPRAIAAGRRAAASYPNLTFHCAPFEEHTLPSAHYDFVSIIATLHHMALASTLESMKRLLKPNGTLTILGLYREETVADHLWSMAAIPIHNIYQHTKPGSRGHIEHQMATQQPQIGLQTIRKTMKTVLPNHQFRRHLFWRYSVIWQKPLEKSL